MARNPGLHVRESEAGLWERLEQRPVGTTGGIFVLLGWAALAGLYFSGVWSLEVTFFLGVGWLTFILSLLSAFAASVHFAHRNSSEQPAVLRLPEWLKDFEDYFRWLTPVIFIVGIIFGHYFWH